MQNYLNFFGGMIKDQQSIFLPQGQGRISLIDVRDIAAVDAEILTAPENHWQKAYDLTGPEALTNEEIARILPGSWGKPITSVDIDEINRPPGHGPEGDTGLEYPTVGKPEPPYQAGDDG